MRLSIAIMAGLLLSLSPANAARPAVHQFSSLQSAVDWVNGYRVKRDLAGVPAAIRALSYHGAFKEPEAAGVYVGFIAGIIGAHPAKADALIGRMLPVQVEDQWVIVRAIAYSGAPEWKELLRRFSARLPARQVMIERYLDGTLPTLVQLTIKPSPTTLERVRDAFTITLPGESKDKKQVLEPTQTLLDTLWGYYLASGSYGPVLRIVELLPWSKDRDNADKLTIGSMAKYTLAMNAARDGELLAMLKTIRNSKHQKKNIAALLDDVINAAETADAGRLRKDALAAIEQLKAKGPAYKREVSTWAKVGQGALAVGCVVAAATGHIELGLPCVIGGGTTNAAMYYMNDN
jgi:hypothetical protein